MKYISKEGMIVSLFGTICVLIELLFAVLSDGIEKITYDMWAVSTLIIVVIFVSHDSIILHMKEYISERKTEQ